MYLTLRYLWNTLNIGEFTSAMYFMIVMMMYMYVIYRYMHPGFRPGIDDEVLDSESNESDDIDMRVDCFENDVEDTLANEMEIYTIPIRPQATTISYQTSSKSILIF